MTLSVVEHELVVEPGRVVVGTAIRDDRQRFRTRSVPRKALDQVLDRFRALRRDSATKDDLERFIQTYGPLPLCTCKSPQPVGHLTEPNGDRCWGSTRVHRLNTYRRWAEELNDLREVADTLRDFRRREDQTWRQFVESRTRPVEPSLVRLAKLLGRTKDKPLTAPQARNLVTHRVNWWLAHGRHETGFTWPKEGTPSRSMEPADLWGYLGEALAQGITGSQLRPCQKCGRMFAELADTTDGRGAPPRYCKQCRNDDPGYAAREASRRYRAKRKK